MFHLKNSTILLITEDKFPVLAVVAVVLAGAALLAIFVYIVIKKTSKLMYLHHILSVERS